MKCLVTGAAGFMGSHLMEYLLEEGYDVIGVDDLSGGFIENVPDKQRFFILDLRNKERVEKVVGFYRPEIIYHLAADATEGRSQFTPVGCVERNLNATVNLLSAALQHASTRRFVFTSSMAVYGEAFPPFVETMPTAPVDIYGMAKAGAEKAIEVLCDVHELEYTIIRPHNVYGPRQNMADPYRNVIGIFMNRMLTGRPIYVYGSGKQQRAFSYVEDITPTIATCGWEKMANGEIFNLGSDEYLSILELVEILEEVTKTKATVEHVDWRPREVVSAWCDHHKAQTILGYEDKTPTEAGVAKMWKWACGKGAQAPQYVNLEIDNDAVPVTWKEQLI